MPGIKLKLDASEAEAASKALRRSLKELGVESKVTEKQFSKLEKNLLNTTAEKKADAAMDSLTHSIKMTRLEAAKLKLQTGDLTGAMGVMVRGVGGAKTATSGLFSSMAALGGAYGIKMVATSFIDAASSAESYRTRLNILLQSQEEGNRLFNDMAKYASKVPFEYDKIMASATNLAAVMKGGVDEINQWMPMIGDLAAATGMSVEDVTGQVIRMYSAGAASADMFREKGVLAMMGFQQGVKYSAEETQRIMFEYYNSTESKIKGAADALGTTWAGMISMVKDAWFLFRNAVMDSGVFDWMKKELGSFLENIQEIKKDNSFQIWARNVGGAFLIVLNGGKMIYKGWMLVFQGLQRGVATWVKRIVDGFAKVFKAAKFFTDKLGLDSWSKKLGEGIQFFEDVSWAAQKELDNTSSKIDELAVDAERAMKQTGAAFVQTFSDDIPKAVKKTDNAIKKHKEAVRTATHASMSAMDLYSSAVGRDMTDLEKSWDFYVGTVEEAKASLDYEQSAIVKSTSEMVSNLEGVIGDNLKGLFSGEFKGIGEMWDDMLDVMMSSIGDFIAKIAQQRIIMPMLSGVGGMFGLPGMSFGGMTPGGGGGGGLGLSDLGGLFSRGAWGNIQIGLEDWIGEHVSEDLATFIGDKVGFGGMSSGWFGAGLSGIGSLGMSLITGGPDALKSPQTWLQAGGAAIGSIWGPIGSAVGGLLGSLIGGLIGGGKKPESNWEVTAPGGGFDEEGFFSFTPAYEKESQVGSGYIGNYLKGWGKHTDSDFDEAMVPIYRALDDDITRILDGYADLINKTMGDFEDNPEIQDAFRQIIEGIEWDFNFLEDDTSPDEESIKEMYEGILNKLKQSLDDAGYTETISLFTDLADVLTNVVPAFQELLSTLSEAVTSYYSPLLQLDQKIVEYGGEDFMLGDLQKQYEAMKILYDNAVANGATYDQLADIGLKYFDAAEAYQKYFEKLGGTPDEEYQKELDALNEKYAEGMAESVYEAQLKALQDKFADSDFAKLIEDGFESIDLEELGTGLRDDLTEAFSPEDFNASVLKTLEDFKIGVQESIDSITKAINELHPNVNLDIAVDLDVVGNDVETEYVVTPV